MSTSAAAAESVSALPVSPVAHQREGQGTLDAPEGPGVAVSCLAPVVEGGAAPSEAPDQEGPGPEAPAEGERAEPASAGVSPPPEEEEEARQPQKPRDPGAPTRAQWEDHQATHLPFRVWCPQCVAGRMDNPPHRRGREQEASVPEVHMDYAFCRRHDEEHVTTMLVMKHRQSRAVRCWVVPQKGRWTWWPRRSSRAG